MTPSIVQDSKDGAVLAVHVQPKSSRTECVGRYGDALKVRVAAPPVGDAANEELIQFLAVELSIPPTSVQIKSGARGRQKLLLLKDVPAKHVNAYLMRKGG